MSAGLFLTAFLVYIAALIALSVRLSRRQASGEDFLLGDRRVPLFLMLGTTVATMVGTGSSMGAIGKGYSDGWAGSLYGIGGAAGILLLAALFGHVRRYNFMTFAEEIAFYYGANKTLKSLIALIMVLASAGWLGAHILGGGMYLAWVVGIDLLYAKIIVALGFGVYVVIGGYMAVVWTDTLQAVVLFVGFLLIAGMAVAGTGGFSGVVDFAQPEQFAFLRGGQLLPSASLAFAIFVGVMATPAFRQRIYSSDSEQTVKRSFYLSGLLYLLFSFIPAIIGMAAFQLDPGLENANFAFPFVASEVLPAGLGLAVLIAGLSATLSSASSDVIAAVSILLRDVWILFAGRMPAREKAVAASRWGVAGITGLALLFTLAATGIIDYIQYMISLVLSGLFVCAMMGRYWKRATWQGGIAALAGGALCAIVVLNVPAWIAFWGNPSIPAVICAALAGVLGSYLSPPNAVPPAEALDILARERAEMEMRGE
ncbi:MAG: sodium:solute symporter family protein [Candidatus Hydrogenedentes bacterium]|nr:sodium:solute symporter family protein [Candidatus Hydrogenedentota bacterium]